MLEEDIAVLVRAAHGGMLGVESALAERLYSVHVCHLFEVVIVPDLDLLDLVGCTEAVKEVDERNSALDCSQMSYGAEIHDLLGVGLSQHSEACLTARVNVTVVAEDVEGVRRYAAGGYVEYGREQLARDLVHIRDHKEQTLRSGVGGGQSARVERTVDSTCRACLRLHLFYLYGSAEDVLHALSRPLIYIVSHGAGRCDGVDARNLGERVAHPSGGVVAVHGFHFSCHVFSSCFCDAVR